MSEPVPETRLPEPVEPVGEVARKNVALGLALLVTAILIIGGTIAVSFIYLHYD